MSEVEKLQDVFEFDSTWTISESTNESFNGMHVLGKIQGPFFAVNQASRNGRFYSRRLWETAIRKNETNLTDGSMVGTIGHDIELDDKNIRDGKVSHVINKLWISDNESYGQPVGMGSAYILDTPTGKILESYLRGGVKLAISSRAMGRFTGRNGSNQMLDEDNYILEGFDFTKKPGVSFAYPKLVNESHSSMGESPMPDDNMTKLIEDKINLQSKLNEALDALTKSNAKVMTVEGENTRLIEAYTAIQEENKQISEKLETARGGMDRMNESADAYRDLGSPDDLSQLIDACEAYAELGTPDQVNEALDRSRELLETYGEFGSPEEINKVMDICEAYIKLGTLQEIKESLYYLNAYSNLGHPNNISAVMDLTESYGKLGSLGDIKKVINLTEGIIDGSKKKAAKKMHEEFGVDQRVVESLVRKMGPDEAKRTLFAIGAQQKQAVSERYRADRYQQTAPSTTSSNRQSVVQKPRFERVMESLSR